MTHFAPHQIDVPAARSERKGYRARLAGLCFAALCAAGLLPDITYADNAILIGGGYDLQGSQGQIELNTKWVQQILETRGMQVTTFYTDGENPGLDVHYLQPESDYASPLEPLSRIFDTVELDRTNYRNHSVERVTDSTERSILLPQLRDLLGLESTNSTLLVYNGHGNQSLSTPDKVTMHLWGDTVIQAQEVHTLLEETSSPFRFVMTQCYSGGFHRIAYDKPDTGITLADGPARCGFTAESAYRLSEGCSSSINSSDYRDYTTFFFAALTGINRQGKPLDINPDQNNDGVTTLREAHFYTLANAVSTDLPRSTSEHYLSNWAPWYLRWAPTHASLPDNEYAALFGRMASRLSLDPGAPQVARQIQSSLEQITDQRSSLVRSYAKTQNDIESLQSTLQGQLITRWPELVGPHTTAYANLATSGELRRISTIAAALKEYPTLVKLQQQLQQLEHNVLENERDSTQMQKLQRLRKLSTLQEQLLTHGTPHQIDDYNSLVSCEESTLR